MLWFLDLWVHFCVPLADRRLLQEQLTDVAHSVIEELDNRFPQHQLLEALSILHPDFYTRGGSFEKFQEHLDVLCDHYGVTKEVDGTIFPPVIDAEAAKAGDGWFYQFAKDIAERRFRQRDDVVHAPPGSDDGSDDASVFDESDNEAQVSGGGAHMATSDEESTDLFVSDSEEIPNDQMRRLPKLTEFWRAMTMRPDHAHSRIADYVKFAEILVVLVGGSVEDERVFSSVSFVLGKLRHSLDRNMETCVRAKVQNFFTAQTFSYDKALVAWQSPRSLLVA